MKFSTTTFTALLAIAIAFLAPNVSTHPNPNPTPADPPPAYGTPPTPGKFSMNDIEAFMSAVPDEVLALARETFPAMTDYEIMTLLLDGDDDAVEKMVGGKVDARFPAAGGEGEVGGTARRKKPQFRNAVVIPPSPLAGQQGEQGEQQVPASAPAPAAAPVGNQQPSGSLRAELASMTPAERGEVRALMASLGLPDVTRGELPEGFDPAAYEGETGEIARMLVEQLGPGAGGAGKAVQDGEEVGGEVGEEVEMGLELDQAGLSREQVDAILAILDGPQAQAQVQVQGQQQPAPAPAPAPSGPRPLPADIRTLIPPRPPSQIPVYPTKQLSTPHNPLYAYPTSLLAHSDPYHTLDPATSPPSTSASTSKTRLRLPPLPDAHTRYHLNTPQCVPPPSSPSPAGPPKFTDCTRAISNILPRLTASTCAQARGWAVTRQVVSEFGTCRVVARNEGGKAGCVELDKVKYLAGRVLRECGGVGGVGEGGQGGRRDRRRRTVEGRVGYLFLNEEKRGWDVMYVGLERAVFE